MATSTISTTPVAIVASAVSSAIATSATVSTATAHDPARGPYRDRDRH